MVCAALIAFLTPLACAGLRYLRLTASFVILPRLKEKENILGKEEDFRSDLLELSVLLYP